MKIEYVLNEVEKKAAADFIKEQKAKLLEKQRKEMSPEDFDHYTYGGKYPYTGAIGGAVSYEIYHTSIGTGIKIRYLDEVKDITDFSNW